MNKNVLALLFTFILVILSSFALGANDSNSSIGISTTNLALNSSQNEILNSSPVIITFFYSETCPHCHAAMDFFDELSKTRSDFVLDKYDVVYNESARAYALNYTQELGVELNSVPAFFIGNQSFVGYSERMNEDIISAIDLASFGYVADSKDDSQTINLPILGKLDPYSISPVFLALILGFVDGFNPCAFFVLFFLLSILAYSNSRKKMLFIGLTFVLISAIIYFVFVSAWMNFFTLTSNKIIVTSIAGIVALIIAAFNIKDFFAFKKGASLSISDKNKSNLIKKMRNLVKTKSFWGLFIGTVILAVTVNLYELLCTLGLPMVFTGVISTYAMTMFEYYSLIAIYCLAYIVPLLVIVIGFSIRMGAKKLSQNQGENLKLLSGMMMLALGFLMLFKPGLLQNVFVTIGFIILAIILTGLIILFKKRINICKEKKEQKTGIRHPKK